MQNVFVVPCTLFVMQMITFKRTFFFYNKYVVIIFHKLEREREREIDDDVKKIYIIALKNNNNNNDTTKIVFKSLVDSTSQKTRLPLETENYNIFLNETILSTHQK